VNWRWKGRKIEEVKEFKYLGYTLMQNSGQEAQEKEEGKVNDSNEKGMGNRQEIMEKGLEKENMVIRYSGMDGDGIWSEDIRLEGKERN